MKDCECHHILVVGNPDKSFSTGSFLLKFINIIKVNTKNVLVISGDMVNGDNVSWIRSKYILKKKGGIANVFYYLLSQLQTIVEISNVSKDISLIIILPTPFILPILYSKLKNKKVIIFAAQKSDKIFIKMIERLCFIFSDLIIIESCNIVNELRLHKFKNKIVKGNIYVDVDFFKNNKNINERRNVIGYIGALSKRKGIDKFIEAVPNIIEKYPDIEFLIGGTGPLEETLRFFSNCNHKVKFIGTISQKDLPIYLNDLKLFVLPSISEGVPNIILEAMACGTPVLATSVGGISDIIQDNINGFIMNNNSSESIIENIDRVLKCPNLDEIVKNANKLIENEFTYKSASRRYEKILKLACNK